MLTQRHNTTPRRAAFTLVEILVVILIIGILVSLTAGTAMKILGKGEELQARSEISQLDLAIGQFKSKFDVEYIPNRFMIRKDYSTATDTLSVNSFNYLKRVFGGRILNTDTGWAGAEPTELHGNQCLVFFLGGINQQGFSTNRQKPLTMISASNPEEARIGPFFEFRSSKLSPTTSTTPQAQAYLDPWDTPYFYMTAINRTYYSIGASATATRLNDVTTTQMPSSLTLPLNESDTVVKALRPTPFFEAEATASTPRRYINPGTHQIVSAGSDMIFGPGSRQWNAAGTAWAFVAQEQGYAGGYPGADDIANFRSKALGQPE